MMKSIEISLIAEKKRKVAEKLTKKITKKSKKIVEISSEDKA